MDATLKEGFDACFQIFNFLCATERTLCFVESTDEIEVQCDAALLNTVMKIWLAFSDSEA